MPLKTPPCLRQGAGLNANGICPFHAEPRQNVQLTDQQREAMLPIGDPESEYETITGEVLNELSALGLLHKRPTDGNLDFTDLGEAVYDALVGE